MQLSKRTLTIFISLAFVVAIIAVGVLLLINQDKEQSAAAKTNTEVRIAITDEGFSPATVTLERRTTVVWSNDTAEPHQVGANPYPDASSLPGLHSETIAPGDTYSYTFDATGTYGYADYARPTTSGSVQVR